MKDHPAKGFNNRRCLSNCPPSSLMHDKKLLVILKIKAGDYDSMFSRRREDRGGSGFRKSLRLGEPSVNGFNWKCFRNIFPTNPPGAPAGVCLRYDVSLFSLGIGAMLRHDACPPHPPHVLCLTPPTAALWDVKTRATRHFEFTGNIVMGAC